MADTERIIGWIETGKQLGKVFSFDRNGKTIWSSVGIQKRQNTYKVYADEIEEEKMDAEIYLRDEINKFDNVINALLYIDENTQTNSLELQPCEGWRIHGF